MSEHLKILTGEAIELLKELIAIPSFSKEEGRASDRVQAFLESKNIECLRIGNNVYAFNEHFDPDKPNILLNSHLDTVKPNQGYTRDPFSAFQENGRITGLGSNDAGASLVSLISAFRFFYDRKGMTHNIVLAATAEEEISGRGGIELLIPSLPEISFAIVGEPTQMQMAIAERGLLVLDCSSRGRAGHAARNEGDNAIQHAIRNIAKISALKFPRVSHLLGAVTLNVTVIETENKAHNVIPSKCDFVIDVRVNEMYTFDEILEIIRENTDCEIAARSTRLKSSIIPIEHPLVQAGIRLGLGYYGSPTTSDKALMPFPALKLGPGDSARSHTADEYIYISEIEDGIAIYCRLLNEIL